MRTPLRLADIHIGELFGKYFFAVVDASAVGLPALTVIGAYIRYVRRQKRRGDKSVTAVSGDRADRAAGSSES